MKYSIRFVYPDFFRTSLRFLSFIFLELRLRYSFWRMSSSDSGNRNLSRVYSSSSSPILRVWKSFSISIDQSQPIDCNKLECLFILFLNTIRTSSFLSIEGCVFSFGFGLRFDSLDKGGFFGPLRDDLDCSTIDFGSVGIGFFTSGHSTCILDEGCAV